MSLNRTQCFALVLVNLALATGGTVSLHAQANLGSISGVVQDSSGAAVPNIPVTARSASTKNETQVLTNANGMYVFPALQVGEYDLSVQVSGFKTSVHSNVRVISSVTTTQDITLELGATTQSVRVTAVATVLDTSVTAVGTTRVVEEIQDLPLLMTGNQRSSVSFVRTLPGTSWVPGLIDDGSQGINVASIYGAPEGGESYQIDGIMASVGGWGQLRDDFSPPPEMIEEMRLTTNTSSEYGGQNSGVGVSLVFKSGTNKLHGSVFEYLRNDALDARNFYAANSTSNKQNEWGFVLGGPLVIPHVYNGTNRTFFFGMYSGYRLRRTPAGVTASVPTARMRGGDFGELLGAQVGTDAAGRPIYKGEIYDPATTRPGPNGTTIRDPFAYQGQLNHMDPGIFSSISNSFQKGYPLPTLPGIASNWLGLAIPSPVNADKGSIKIDHIMAGGSKTISGTFQDWKRTQVFGGVFDPHIANTYEVVSPTWLARVAFQWTLGSNVVLNIRTAVNHCADRLGSWDFPADTYGATAGLKGVYYPAVPPINITSMTGFGTNYGGQILNPGWMWPANGDLSWSKGKHSLKFGVQYASQNFINKSNNNSTGVYNFSPLETGLPGAPAGTGYGYASYLLGVVDNSTLSTPVDVRFGSSIFGFYAQDSWRFTPKLTISYGLRWDVTLPSHEQYNRFSAFSPSTPNPGAGGNLGALTFWGDGPGRNGLRRQASVYYREFSPRLGFAYTLTPKTLVRASYGLSSPAFEGTAGRGISVSGQANITVTPASLNAGVTPAFDWDNGFPTQFIPPLPSLNPALLNGSNVSWTVLDDVRPSRTQNLSFGLEREVPGGILLRASYIGNLTHGMAVQGLSINQMPLQYLSLGSLLLQSASSSAAQAAGIALPYPGFTGSVAQALRPYPQFGNVNQDLRPTGFNEYNAAEFTAQKHTGYGLSFLVSYTISKQLTNHAFYYGQGRSNTVVQYTGQLREAKMLSELDRPQALALSYVYELPVGPGKRFANTTNPVLKQVIGGWQVAGVFNYFSGTPIQVATNQTLSGGYGAIWANRVPGVPIKLNSCGSIDPGDPAKKFYLNAKAFADPAPFTLGNIRNLGDVRTCGYLNENISAIKEFAIRERARVHFSADFNNIFNRHIWQGTGVNIDVPSQFGTFGALSIPAGSGGGANIGGGASDPRIIQLQLKVEF